MKNSRSNSTSETELEGDSAAEVAEPNTPDAASYDIHLKPGAKRRPVHSSPRHSEYPRHHFNKNQTSETDVTATRHQPRQEKGWHRGEEGEEEEEEEEEIGLHKWESRGKLIPEVPWLKDRTGA